MIGGKFTGTAAAVVFLLTVLTGVGRGASEGIVPEAVIGTVPVVPRAAVSEIYRRVDRLVPELRKLPSEKIVLLECLYHGRTDRDEHVSRALGLAAQIEKYLREHHNLSLDLWLAAHPEADLPGGGASLVFSVLSDSYVAFDRTSPEPVTLRESWRYSSGETK